LFFLWLGVFRDFQTALYFSGATFTTIGYGDVVLPAGRYLLGPLVGITGLLMAGVSTAVMAAAVTNVINRRLAHLHACRQAEKQIIST
jgi:voltage-gated potassium channel Kch